MVKYINFAFHHVFVSDTATIIIFMHECPYMGKHAANIILWPNSGSNNYDPYVIVTDMMTPKASSIS